MFYIYVKNHDFIVQESMSDKERKNYAYSKLLVKDEKLYCIAPEKLKYNINDDERIKQSQICTGYFLESYVTEHFEVI